MESIEQLIPHRPPFLFRRRDHRMSGVDSLTTRRRVRPDEDYFRGRVPQPHPIMRGVLGLRIGFAQSGCALLRKQMASGKEDLARYTPV